MNLFTWGENQVRKFNIWDIGVFKIYLFSLGAIAGAYFSNFILEYICYFVLVAIVSMAWLFYRMFR